MTSKPVYLAPPAVVVTSSASPGASWDAFVWGKNITDEKYFTSAAPGLGNLARSTRRWATRRPGA